MLAIVKGGSLLLAIGTPLVAVAGVILMIGLITYFFNCVSRNGANQYSIIQRDHVSRANQPRFNYSMKYKWDSNLRNPRKY